MGKKGYDEPDELETEPTDCTIAAVRIRQSPRCEATARIAAAYAQRGLRVAFVLFGEEGERSCTTCSAFYARAPSSPRRVSVRLSTRSARLVRSIADSAAWPPSPASSDAAASS